MQKSLFAIGFPNMIPVGDEKVFALSTVEMAWATKRPANEPLTGLFSGPLTAQFYLLFLIELLPIFEISFHFHFSVKCGKRS